MSDNATKYCFADFTEDQFVKLTERAKRNHRFSFFDDYDLAQRPILWRHDVDKSLHRAAWMAKVERELSVRSTYFIMLHSWAYNVLEKEIQSILSLICEPGHRFGLHSDPGFYGNHTDANALEIQLAKEKSLLEDIVGTEVRGFSVHNPTEEMLLCREVLAAQCSRRSVFPAASV